MSTKKELPPIEGMSASEAQVVCLAVGGWYLFEHLDSGHYLIDDWARTVHSYCAENPRVKGQGYNVATDLGVELDPIETGYPRRIAPRKRQGTPPSPARRRRAPRP